MLPREKINHWIYKSKSGPFINVMILMLMISFVYSWNADKAYIYWPGTTHNSSKSHYRFSVLLCLLEDKNKKNQFGNQNYLQVILFDTTEKHESFFFILSFYLKMATVTYSLHSWFYFLEKIESSYNYSPKVNLLWKFSYIHYVSILELLILVSKVLDI